MTDSANPYQGEYWNSAPGQTWVTHEDDLDRQHQAVLDLLLAEAVPQPGERVIDIGCGTGASCRALARAVGPGGAVRGLDISAPLLERARERAAGLPQVGFDLGDAQVMALPEAEFDAAVSRFGVMFFADTVAAFTNIAKGLRPGGRMVLAAWAALDRNPWFALTQAVAVARLGPGGPSDPLAPGPMAFADIDRVVGLLAAAGLQQPSGCCHQVDLHHPGGVASVVALARSVGPIPRMMREKGGTPEDLAAIEADLAARLAPYAAADGLRIPAGINVFKAVRGQAPSRT